MVLAIYIEPDGTQREIDLKKGWSVMEGAVRAGVEKIVAECGGKCSCATCHVYVEETRLPELPPPDEMENAMLESVAAERRFNSRLSCQLHLGAALSGIAFLIPDKQY
jgi:2Fe-2S ferredoxin